MHARHVRARGTRARAPHARRRTLRERVFKTPGVSGASRGLRRRSGQRARRRQQQQGPRMPPRSLMTAAQHACVRRQQASHAGAAGVGTARAGASTRCHVSPRQAAHAQQGARIRARTARASCSACGARSPVDTAEVQRRLRTRAQPVAPRLHRSHRRPRRVARNGGSDAARTAACSCRVPTRSRPMRGILHRRQARARARWACTRRRAGRGVAAGASGRAVLCRQKRSVHPTPPPSYIGDLPVGEL